MDDVLLDVNAETLAGAEKLLHDKKFEAALERFQDALETAGTDTQALPAARGIIICLRALDRPETLEEFCRRMGRLLPDQALFDCQLGELLMARDEMDEAAQVIARGIAKDDRFSGHWSRLAEAFMMRGYAARAIECLEKAIQADPDSVPAHFHLAQCQAALGRIEAATQALDQCLAIEPDFILAEQLRDQLLSK
jgi:tetratricopeptide (TPR) repeat protein